MNENYHADLERRGILVIELHYQGVQGGKQQTVYNSKDPVGNLNPGDQTLCAYVVTNLEVRKLDQYNSHCT